jgi:parallel beta-helix repeat protein
MVTRGFNLENEFRIFGEGPTSLFKLQSGLPGRTDDRYQAAMFMGRPSYGEDPAGQLSTEGLVIKNMGVDMQRNPLNFDATRATYPMLAGVRLFNPISCTIDGVTILNPWYAGIIMQTTSLGISCTLNKVQNCTITLQPNWYASGVIPISNPLLLGIQLASFYDFNTQNGAKTNLTRDNPNYIPSRTSYNIIKNNTISGGSHGVTTPNVNHNTFDGNTVSGCSHRGFHIISTSDYNIISNNIVSNIGSTGIHLAYDCNHTTIINNTVSKILGNEGDCIKSYVNCNYNLISNNNVSDFYLNGIRVAHGANNNTITQNIVKGTGTSIQTGIKILANTYNQYYIDGLTFNDELTANNNICTNNNISSVHTGILVGDELNFTPPRYNNNTVEDNIITP